MSLNSCCQLQNTVYAHHYLKIIVVIRSVIWYISEEACTTLQKFLNILIAVFHYNWLPLQCFLSFLMHLKHNSERSSADFSACQRSSWHTGSLRTPALTPKPTSVHFPTQPVSQSSLLWFSPFPDYLKIGLHTGREKKKGNN